MLTMRKRGRVYHIRGSIKVGSETRIVKEHSTGCDRREDAEAYRSKLETEARHELLHGPGGRANRLTFADAVVRYIERPGGVKSYDLWRLNQMNEIMGDYWISQIGDAWSSFKQKRCAGRSIATVARFRAIGMAAVNYLAEEEGFEASRIKSDGSGDLKRPRWLTDVQADRLIASYAEHVQPIAVTLRWQGLRIGEVLRLEWQHVDWKRSSLYIAETKNGEPRTVTMHPRVRKVLHRVWVGQESPSEGTTFLNRVGEPYADPRQYELPGGSPIKKAHATACKRAGITDFHVHDWRHHWASHCVMAGIDLETIRQEGGWKSLRMVEKYATVSAAHRKTQMRKLK
jgi:integrase